MVELTCWCNWSPVFAYSSWTSRAPRASADSGQSGSRTQSHHNLFAHALMNIPNPICMKYGWQKCSRDGTATGWGVPGWSKVPLVAPMVWWQFWLARKLHHGHCSSFHPWSMSVACISPFGFWMFIRPCTNELCWYCVGPPVNVVGPTTLCFFDHPSLFDKDLGMSLGLLRVLGIKIIACEICITFTRADMWKGTLQLPQ